MSVDHLSLVRVPNEETRVLEGSTLPSIAATLHGRMKPEAAEEERSVRAAENEEPMRIFNG